MSGLKPRWKRVKFGEVVRLCRETCKDPSAEGIDRVIGLEHLEPGDLRVRSWAHVANGTTFTQRVRPGQVLFGKRRAYQRKIAVADFDAICSGDIYVFESAEPKRLLPALLPFLCQTEAFFKHAVGTSAGSLSPRTNWSSLANFEFALPPLEEQLRVFRLLQALDQAWQSADYLAGCARISLHSLLEHLHGVARRRWPAFALAEIVDEGRPVTYGILMPGTGYPGGIPVIKVKDFPAGEIDQSDILLTSPEIAKEYRRSELRVNDVLVSIRGTIGRIAIVPESLSGANITQDTARLSFGRSTHPEYARAMLESASMQRMLKSNIPPPAPAGMPPAKAKPRDSIQGLNIGELRRVTLPVPPIPDQLEIAAVVSSARASLRETTLRAESLRKLGVAAINQCLWVSQ